MKPEYVIYKNNEKIGQAVTWHKALDILIIQEGLSNFRASFFQGIVLISQINNPQVYKIIKER